MPQCRLRIRAAQPGLLLAAAVGLGLLAGGEPPAQAFIVNQLPALSDVCKEAGEIAVLKVEKVDRDKKAIVYSKVRDLKGTFPGGRELAGTFTIILGEVPKTFHPLDNPNRDQLNEAILERFTAAWAKVRRATSSVPGRCKAGKLWGVPVYRLLGGPTRDRIRVYPTAKAVKTGGSVRAFAGNPSDIAQLVKGVKHARQQVGADGAVMFDGCGFTTAW